MFSRKQIEHFWKKIDIRSSSECWEWQLSCDKYGYGAAKTILKNYKAHRLAYEFTYGIIPEGMLVCHTCDNRRCCNPAHLWLGTPGDNMRDRDNKHRGNHPDGERCTSHKLKECEVNEIKKLYSSKKYTQKELGEQFMISQTQIHRIITGKRWKYLNKGEFFCVE